MHVCEFERKLEQTFILILLILESERERHSISRKALILEKGRESDRLHALLEVVFLVERRASRQTPFVIAKSILV